LLFGKEDNKVRLYNYFMLIGFVVNDVELKEVADGKKVAKLRLAVKREFQNMNGEYDTDFINISVWEFLAEHAVNYLKKGARVAVKGRICPKKGEHGDVSVFTNELYADRLIFLGESGIKEFDSQSLKAKEE
jgi:single-strand DNA-binding protein